MGRACAEERSGRTRANSYFVNSARSWFWGNSGATGVDSSSGLPSSAARFLLVPTWRVMITIFKQAHGLLLTICRRYVPCQVGHEGQWVTRGRHEVVTRRFDNGGPPEGGNCVFPKQLTKTSCFVLVNS